MSRIHDMGGRFGDGPIIPEAEKPVFHDEWHKRALAVTLAAGSLGKWNIDMSRHAREALPPVDYLRFSYYEKWMAALADLLVDTGVVTPQELASEVSSTSSPLSGNCLKADRVATVLAAGGPADRSSDIVPQFAVGDAVITRRLAENHLVPGGHTRLPNYAAGATGRILKCHGAHVLPDSNAHGLGEAPEPLYSVVFPASELWAAAEHPDDQVALDLWQSYLVPA